MLNPLFRELIALTEQFEAQNPSGQHDLVNFASWLNQRVVGGNQPVPTDSPEWNGQEEGVVVDDVITSLVARMNRFAKAYARTALQGSAIGSLEEFVMVIELTYVGEKTKTELIERNALEKPTGIEIINRLIRKGLVAEKPNPSDKRSKKLAITDEGRQALGAVVGKLRKVSHIVGGNLTVNEKLQLLSLLQKLDHYHYDIYKTSGAPDIDVLFGKLPMNG